MSPLARYLAAYAVYVGVIHLFKGPWQRPRQRRDLKVIDGWTWTHVAWGALARHFGLSLPVTAALAVANEGAEIAIRRTRPGMVWGFGELASNRIVDIFTTMLGWWLWNRLRRR